MAEYVGWKSFTAHAPLSDDEMQSPAVVDRIVGFARTAPPLLEWGWAAVDGETPTAVPIHAPSRPLPKPDFSECAQPPGRIETALSSLLSNGSARVGMVLRNTGVSRSSCPYRTGDRVRARLDPP